MADNRYWQVKWWRISIEVVGVILGTVPSNMDNFVL